MKYLVIKTTKDGIQYKRYKCIDGWSKNKSGCWQFSKAGAQRIADRLNKQLSEYWAGIIHYSIQASDAS